VRYKGGVAVSTVQAAVEVEVEVIGSALGAHPGAELVGIVRGVGESAQHLSGKIVVAPRLLPCGECDLCRRGRVKNCPSLYSRPTRPLAAERLPARFLIPLQPPYLQSAPAEETLYQYAAFADALLSPYAGLVRAGVSPGTLCVVLGGGPRGALATVTARALGLQVAILCADADERARLCAPPYGALHALDPSQHEADSVKSELLQICRQAGLPGHGWYLLETSGGDAGRARALSLLESGGTAILLDRAQPLSASLSAPGLPAELAAGPGLSGVALLQPIAAQGCMVLGAGPAHPDLLPELLALIERTSVPLSALTRAVSPDEIESTMAARRQGLFTAADRLTLPIVQFPAQGPTDLTPGLAISMAV
jgi:threonine dehydrogenase-like Zn-dependent dehydrogenase